MVILSTTPNFALAERHGLDLQAMAIHARALIADRIKATTASDQAELIAKLVIEYGGTLVTPGTSNWDNHECEISILGCSSRGDTIEAAAAQWAKAASRMATEHTPEAA